MELVLVYIKTIAVDLSIIIAIAAVIISFISLFVNSSYATKNIRLSTQNALFKTVSEKARDCNNLWDKEPDNEKNDSSPHFKISTEIMITIEIINKSFELFEKNYKRITDDEKDYYYLFWKQLNPDIRGWVRDHSLKNSKEFSEIYQKQIKQIHHRFELYFEKGDEHK